MRVIRIIAFSFLGVLLLGCSNGENKQYENRGYLVEIGDKPANIEFSLTDGTSTSLKELRGKVVLLQFTASWCSVCRKEMPHLENEVWQRFKDDDFVLIGVDYDEPLEKVIAFKKQMKITYPMSLDPNADIFGQFAHKKSGVTRNVLINKDGEIVFMTRLYEREEFERMVREIEKLLKF